MKARKQLRKQYAHRPEIVAEIGTGHGGDLDKARDLIAVASAAGADVAKFQWVIADEILHQNSGLVKLPGGSIALYERFRQLEREPDFYRSLKGFCDELDIEFLCTPFGEQSARALMEMGQRRFKIASPELNHLPLLRILNRRKHRVILSTGVSRLTDIETACEVMDKAELALLHCITAYPAPEDEYNLSVIPSLSAVFGVPVGVSDHSLDPALVPTLATILGARIIEKHIKSDDAEDGLDDPIALTPKEFARMCARVHTTADRIAAGNSSPEVELEGLRREFGRDRVNKALGTGVKKPAESELANYGRSNRSLHATKDLTAGTAVTTGNSALLRSEHNLRPGVPPQLAEQLYGTVLTRDIPAGEGIRLEDLLRTTPDDVR